MAYPLPDRPKDPDHPDLPPLFVPSKPMPREWRELLIENVEKDGKAGGRNKTPTIVENEV